MNLPAKLLLIYATIFGIFLVASSFLFGLNGSSLISQIFIIPVVAFLIYSMTGLMRKKDNNALSFNINASKTIVFFVILMILSAISIITISNQPPNQTTIQKDTQMVLQVRDIPTPTPEEVIVQINSHGNPYVNLREEASLNAKVVSHINNGDKFILITKDNDWYKITNKEDLTGFVYKDYLDELTASNSATTE